MKNIWWKDITPDMVVKDLGPSFVVVDKDGKTFGVFWSDASAAEAQRWLADQAKVCERREAWLNRIQRRHKELIEVAQIVLAERKDNLSGLSLDYLEGFREGLAEFVGALTKTAAADNIEELS